MSNPAIISERLYVRVHRIGRKTTDGNETIWLVCEDGYAHQFAEGVSDLRLYLDPEHDGQESSQ